MKTFKDMRSTGEAKRADATKVQLDNIHPEPGFNVRAADERLEEHVEAIKRFILNGGQLPPLEVRPREEGGVFIVDGHSRAEGYRRARAEGAPIEWIEVRPFQGNDADRIARMATSNEGLKLTPLEQALIYKRLRGMGLDVPAIAKLVNKSGQHVSQTLHLADANTDLQQAVKDGKVSAAVAVELHKKHGEKAGQEVEKLQEVAAKRGGKLGGRVTKAIVEQGTKVLLNENEVKAVDLFIATHHAKWKEIAETILTEDERRNLEARLAK